MRSYPPWAGVAALLAVLPAAGEGSVDVRDTGPSRHPATWECTAGHPVEVRDFTIDPGGVAYGFHYSGCQDPSHGEERPSAEGNFGMPRPARCNFYAGGFIGIVINGKDAVRHRVVDMQVIETGPRGSLQLVFAHPDATVGLRLAMLPGGNHLLALINWTPREGATIDTVQVKLTCYPSYFTTFNKREGDRHCRTPRTDEPQGKSLAIEPAQDAWLYYYDTVFDVAKGEGEGPCATLLASEGLTGGSVYLGGYGVSTTLNYNPAAGQARLGFYDFAGRTNADAQAYLEASGAADLAELQALDFRPEAVRTLDLAKFRAETERYLAEAKDDGQALRPKLDALLRQLTEQSAKATAGDWQAEAALSKLLRDSDDLLWKLRIFAMLNG